MRNVWLRIGLGAVGIFLVGMIVVKVARVGRDTVVSMVDSDDPIVIPLMGIVPFQLGTERLGDLRRVTLLRDAPDHIIGVKVVARLSDSATVEPFKDCAFLTLTNGAGGDSTGGDFKVNEHSRFQCLADTSAMGSFGTIEIRHTQGKEPTTLERTLVFPPEVIADIQRAMSHRHQGEAPLDEDSLSAAIDSITADALQRAEAARAAAEGGRAPRRTAPPSAPAAPAPPGTP
jgi:hypothetical protein